MWGESFPERVCDIQVEVMGKNELSGNIHIQASTTLCNQVFAFMDELSVEAVHTANTPIRPGITPDKSTFQN